MVAKEGRARHFLAELVDQSANGMTTDDGCLTVKAYCEGWLADKISRGMRPTTARSYRYHVDSFIVPTIGHMRLRDVRPDHVDAVLRQVKAGPATVRRVHAPIRSALATAKRRRLIPWNPASDLELPTAARPKVHPWEPEELGKFLDAVAGDDLSAVFELIAATGLRRGEAVGLRWSDVDLARGRLTVRQQLVQLDGEQDPCPYCGEQHRGAVFGKPKTASGEDRIVDLDGGVIGVLIAHRLQQDMQRAEWGSQYSEHGLVFAQADGTPIPPERVTKRFTQLVKAAELRAIRLHDLRHGQASLMLAAGVPMAVVSKRLGHSTISLTSDTYSHLLDGVGRDAAEAAASLVPRAGKGNPPDGACDQSVTNSALETTEGPRQNDGGPGLSDPACAPPGTRTPNPLIKSQLLCQLS